MVTTIPLIGGGMRSRYLVLLLLLLFLIVNIPLPNAVAKIGTLDQSTWGGSNNDYGQAVAVDSSGNSYVVGYTWSFTSGTPSIFLLKYSFTGTLLMQRLWSDSADDYAYGVALDHSGNIYIAGWTDHLGGPSMLVLKFNPAGGLVWQKTYAGSSHPAYAQAIAVDSTGNIYVTGYYASASSADQNATLLKFDPTGNLLWQRSWGGSNPDQGSSLALDSAGNVYVAGSTNSFGAGGADAFLLKFTSAGSLLNQVTWGGSSDDKATGVALDASGNAYVTGSTLSAGLTSDAFLLKFNSAGSLVMKRLYALTGATYGNGIAVNSSASQVWIAGSTIIGNNITGLILRLTTSGSIISQTTWGGNGGSDAANAIAGDVSGNAVVTGYVPENGPYGFATVTGSFTNSSLNTTNPVVAPTDPGFATGFASGSISTPFGITSYAGGSDVFEIKFGTLPLISFLTLPATAGTIIFSRTAYGSGSSGSYTYGTYSINATSAPGYIFTNWTVRGDLTINNRYSSLAQVTVTGPGTLIASFAVAIANITVGIIPGGLGTVTCNGQTYTADQSAIQIRYNSTLACTANPYAGYRFGNWTGLSTAPSASTSFNVTRSGVLSASFATIPIAPSLAPITVLLSGVMFSSVLVITRRRIR